MKDAVAWMEESQDCKDESQQAGEPTMAKKQLSLHHHLQVSTNMAKNQPELQPVQSGPGQVCHPCLQDALETFPEKDENWMQLQSPATYDSCSLESTQESGDGQVPMQTDFLSTPEMESGESAMESVYNVQNFEREDENFGPQSHYYAPNLFIASFGEDPGCLDADSIRASLPVEEASSEMTGEDPGCLDADAEQSRASLLPEETSSEMAGEDPGCLDADMKAADPSRASLPLEEASSEMDCCSVQPIAEQSMPLMQDASCLAAEITSTEYEPQLLAQQAIYPFLACAGEEDLHIHT